MEAKTIYLKDYKPSPFKVDEISLVVDIFEGKTLVTSFMKLFKRQELKGSSQNLELNGENTKLLSIKLNGKELSSDKFQLSAD